MVKRSGILFSVIVSSTLTIPIVSFATEKTTIYMLVMRANKCGIINDYTAKNFYINANKAGWRKNEPARAENESPRLFYQLVYRAVTENEITVQKGAELLRESYDEVVKNCSAMEV